VVRSSGSLPPLPDCSLLTCDDGVVRNEAADDGAAITRAIQGDEAAFGAAVAPHERPIFRHCYRMLGAGPDAEDALQETLLRAWRRLETYDASGSFGGWLYRISTNVCLDVLRSRQGRVDPVSLGPPSGSDRMPGAPDTDVEWVEPIVSAGPGADPQDEVVGREDITLAFVAALQRLAPRQRACLLLHDVIGFNQAEVAEALEITPSSVNSLLFRARETTRLRRGSLVGISDPRMQDLLDRYVRAWQLADIAAFVEVVSDDVRLSMPPLREWYEGRIAVAAFTENLIFAVHRPGGVTFRAGWCNGQPAFASYLPDSDGTLVVNGLQILEVRERDEQVVVTDIVSYLDPGLAIRSGFPGQIS
jgi:RNA polymerase sigma-70 factor, ECF subfamily